MSDKKICFIHYGIGWKDGVNTVINNFASQIKKQRPDLGVCFLGGQIKDKVISGASYFEIPELLPRKRQESSRGIVQKKAELIAKKISKKTKGIKVIVIENPLMGDYHLPAMIGFFIYAKKYKPRDTKLFLRVHDLYLDNHRYTDGFMKLFSQKEIKNIFRGEGVDGFLIINRNLKKRLMLLGIDSKKIF
ncbi:MAG TPA: hypothetical protein ENL27_01725, partial [Candidatus Parcubacteria bacterium]|nr:hypothetical protein [Candidatus Parcubacteria bacterium]